MGLTVQMSTFSTDHTAEHKLQWDVMKEYVTNCVRVKTYHIATYHSIIWLTMRMYGAGTFFDRTLTDIYAMVLNYDLSENNRLQCS